MPQTTISRRTLLKVGAGFAAAALSAGAGRASAVPALRRPRPVCSGNGLLRGCRHTISGRRGWACGSREWGAAGATLSRAGCPARPRSSAVGSSRRLSVASSRNSSWEAAGNAGGGASGRPSTAPVIRRGSLGSSVASQWWIGVSSRPRTGCSASTTRPGARSGRSDPLRTSSSDDYFWGPPVVIGGLVLVGSGSGAELPTARGRGERVLAERRLTRVEHADGAGGCQRRRRDRTGERRSPGRDRVRGDRLPIRRSPATTLGRARSWRLGFVTARSPGSTRCTRAILTASTSTALR